MIITFYRWMSGRSPLSAFSVGLGRPGICWSHKSIEHSLAGTYKRGSTVLWSPNCRLCSTVQSCPRRWVDHQWRTSLLFHPKSVRHIFSFQSISWRTWHIAKEKSFLYWIQFHLCRRTIRILFLVCLPRIFSRKSRLQITKTFRTCIPFGGLGRTTGKLIDRWQRWFPPKARPHAVSSLNDTLQSYRSRQRIQSWKYRWWLLSFKASLAASKAKSF